jgi:hypothetical protein
MSSEALRRDQFHTNLECGRCGAKGDAVWEENSEITSYGPMGQLIRLSDGFFQRVRKTHQGQPEIACVKCGQVHAD